jgi:Family of unknown function (DUF5681)
MDAEEELMSEQSRPPKASPPNGSHSSDAVAAVGYGWPPMHTRFKRGQSGNPRGRRKGQRNVRTVVEETLNQRITIREGDRTRSLTKLDGVVLTMVSGALKGDAKAQASLITMMRSVGMIGEAPEAPHCESVTSNDDALIADYFRRQVATEADNQQSAPTDTTTPSKKTES